MLRILALFAMFCVLAPTAAPLRAADKASDPNESRWVKGPAKANLNNFAEIQVPGGYRFADGKFLQELLKSGGEPVSGKEVGAVFNEKDKWFVAFIFDDVGYVKDDDKDKLDAEKLFKAMKEGNDRGNEIRRKNGVPPLTLIGWQKTPAYDEKTHNLEWALRAESEGHNIINYNIRLLGRKGVMEVILVVDPERLNETLPTFKSLLDGYTYKEGERYAEYRSGDKVAKYGLAALVTGAGVAVAAKLGFFGWLLLAFKKLGKLVVVAVVAVGAFIKRLFGGGKREEASNDEAPPKMNS